ncbi:ArnT family glycosyltransferase [Rufibacter soli]
MESNTLSCTIYPRFPLTCVQTQSLTKQLLANYLKYFILAALLYFPLFGYLERFPIRIWDEARQAINAYEMHVNGNYLVTYFEGQPDMWNTKPPLLIWLQVGFMKLLGVNELAVRLPSALSALLTCGLLLLFSERYLKSFWFGFIAVLVLITSTGYVHLHASRTGDYDALLTLFTTSSGLSFFAFCESRRPRFLYAFFAATALAVLTKSVTGLLFLPALVLYSILQKQFLPLLTNKHFYLGLAACLGTVLTYYLLREAYNPGFLKAVYENELGGRFGEAKENHKEYFWFYYNNFIHLRMQAWYLLAPCGFAVGLMLKNGRVNRLTLFSSLVVITFFLIISAAETKLEWYDVPMYPYLALLTAVLIYYVFNFLKTLEWPNATLKYNVAPFVFLFVVLTFPYQKVLDRTYRPEETPWDKEFYEMGYYLRNASKGHHAVDGRFLAYEGYNAQNQFYLNILKDKGTLLALKDWKSLNPGEVIIATQPHIKTYITDTYQHQIVEEVGNVVSYRIHGRKQ